MEYVIRHASETDLPAIIDLCEKHAAYERVAYDATGKQDRLRNAIFSEPKKLFCFVIDVGEALAGYYTYTFDYSTWEANHFLSVATQPRLNLENTVQFPSLQKRCFSFVVARRSLLELN